MMSNVEAEWAKLSHNCFGAMKVLYWNIIYKLSQESGADYDKILKGAMITGFIEPQHTKIALDGMLGYGGSCFPGNIKAMQGFLNPSLESDFFGLINSLNEDYRNPADGKITLGPGVWDVSL
jgi:UDP-glucose 6-dehydrogenase